MRNILLILKKEVITNGLKGTLIVNDKGRLKLSKFIIYVQF